MRSLIGAMLACTVGLNGQVVPHARTCPKAFTGWQAPHSAWVPYGKSRLRFQTWYHGSAMRKGVVNELGWRADASARAAALTHRLEIRLGNSAKRFSNLSRKFTDNLGNTTVFKSLATIKLPALTREPDVNAPPLWIKGDRPFFFVGPHFVVDVDVRTEASYRFVDRYWADFFLQDSSTRVIHGTSGRSCGGVRMMANHSTGAWHLIQFLGNANAVGVFLIGVESARAASGVRFPIDLRPIGLPGCTLDIDPLLTVAVAADSRGRAILTLPYRVPIDAPLVLHAQGVHGDTRKPLGIATTNAVHSILSRTQLANHIYNWSRDGDSAEFGPFPSNRGAILLLRP